MSNHTSFKGYAIVSCGTLRPELSHLRDDGFLDADKVLYTAPGLHEYPEELEHQLTRQLARAKEYAREVVVVYGSRCYVNTTDPSKDIDRLIQQQGKDIHRVQASNCIDMLADTSEREQLSGEKKVYWLSTGWLKYWRQIFKGWDVGLANETFPAHDEAFLLDPLEAFDEYVEHHPEDLLEFSDWMQIPLTPHKISLERLKHLLLQQIQG